MTSPDGNTAAWCRRNSKYFRKQIREGLRLSHALITRWERLSEEYREYDMASVDVVEENLRELNHKAQWLQFQTKSAITILPHP